MGKSTEERAELQNSLAALERRLGPIEFRRVDELKSYQRDLRKHPEKLIIKLMASISEFSFTLPLLVDEQGTLIAGEARLKAARRLGMAEVPVLVAAQWSATQVKAYRLADNRLGELASWNVAELVLEITELLEIDEVPIELLGWETAEIDVLLDGSESDAKDANDSADAQIEPPAEPVSRPGDLWLLDEHRLLCGNSLDAQAWAVLTVGRTGVMAFVDPPYNVPISGHVCGLGSVQHAEFAMGAGEMDRPQFTGFNTNWLAAMQPHLCDGAIAFLCMDWRHITELTSAIEANHLSLINLCVWNKTNGGMGSLYRSKHELVFVAKKGTAAHINNVELGKHGRYRTNVWDFAGINSFGATRMDDLADHPTVKPVALVAEAIRDVSCHGDIVLDAFMGSGTTILAAERTKRTAYGIEIEPAYVDVAIRRWERLTGRTVTLSGTGQTFSEVAAERLADSGCSPNDK